MKYTWVDSGNSSKLREKTGCVVLWVRCTSWGWVFDYNDTSQSLAAFGLAEAKQEALVCALGVAENRQEGRRGELDRLARQIQDFAALIAQGT
jgi:hypothetical protein